MTAMKQSARHQSKKRKREADPQTPTAEKVNHETQSRHSANNEMPQLHIFGDAPWHLVAPIVGAVDENNQRPAPQHGHQQQANGEFFIHAVGSADFEKNHQDNRDEAQGFISSWRR